MKKLTIVLTLILLIAGCKGPLSSPESAKDKNKVHNVVVKEVIQAAGYTYLNVTEKRKSTWLAIPGRNISKGEKISYRGGMEMTNFHSKELNRDFPSILFLEGLASESSNNKVHDIKIEGKMGEVKREKVNISIPQEEGCISIAKLFETKTDFSDKTVKVKGVVTKINSAIMGKNWVHIQDGTEYNGAFDLTVTTNSSLQVGDTVTFAGKVSLRKDFGYGYSYDVIMEDGKLIK